MTVETIASIAARFFSKKRDEPYIIECETSSGCPLMNELDKASLLDARIIRGACPTCGGIGQVPAAHMPAGATERCPDCANAPVWVIEPAAWGALCEMAASRANAYREQGKWLHADSPDIQEDAMLYAQALIPGADAVVTAEGLEAAYEMVMDNLGYIGPWSELAPLHKGRVGAVTRAALKACGIVVADKVVEVEIGTPLAGEFDARPPGKSRAGEWMTFELGDGDTLYIVRATMTSCDRED